MKENQMRSNRPMLTVYASENSMCPDYEALEQNHLRFVGRKMNSEKKSIMQQVQGRAVFKKGGYDYSVTEITKKSKEVESPTWIIQDKPAKVPHRAEYIQALKKGDLLPADQQTARLAGLTGVYSDLPQTYID